MRRYVLRRLLQAIPTFLGITVLSYALMTASGNPVRTLSFRPGATPADMERRAARLGVNDSWPVQYVRWLLGDDWMRRDTDGDGLADTSIIIELDADHDGEPDPPGSRRGVLRGDFGNSFVAGRPVVDILTERFPATLELSVAGIALGAFIGITIGILAAVTRGGVFDNVTRVLAVVFDAIPSFWLSIMLLLFFSVQLDIFPIGDRCGFTLEPSCPPIYERWEYMILPVFVFATGFVAAYSRIMRASMLDILNKDYILTARAKGLNERVVWFRHGARNALIPIATFLGPAITSLLAGAVIIERIFNYPGVGSTALNAAIQRDFPVVMATTIYAGIATIIGYLISDMLYAWIDPRIRFD